MHSNRGAPGSVLIVDLQVIGILSDLSAFEMLFTTHSTQPAPYLPGLFARRAHHRLPPTHNTAQTPRSGLAPAVSAALHCRATVHHSCQFFDQNMAREVAAQQEVVRSFLHLPVHNPDLRSILRPHKKLGVD